MKLSILWAACGVLAVAGATTVAAEHEAKACGGSWAPYQAFPREEAIAEAERLVQNGRYFTATLHAHHEFPYMNEWSNATSGLEGRALKVMALAITRMDGNLTLGTPWRGWTAAYRKQNLEWAVKSLQALADTNPDDMTLKSYLGEAMSKLPERQVDALSLLEGLAKNDLLATPQGYAALAKLRQASGDAEGRDAAKQRCSAMASSDASACRVPSV